MAPRFSLGKFRRAAPEVWFRIVHAAADHAKSCVDLREQTVEIALGPEGAFENGNIGVLTREAPADRVVSAVPPPRYLSRPPEPPREPRTPQVVELLRKAHAWRQELDAGTVANQAEIARREPKLPGAMIAMPVQVSSGRPATRVVSWRLPAGYERPCA